MTVDMIQSDSVTELYDLQHVSFSTGFREVLKVGGFVSNDDS